MDRNDYNIAINKNTLECWGIIIFVLFVSYFAEVLKGIRTIPYFVVFSIVIFIPYIIALIYNKKTSGNDLRLKYYFVFSYMLLYTFVLMTTTTFVTYVYVIPMVSILTAYCDSKLTLSMFIYVLLINILCIYFQYYSFINHGSMISFGLKERITMWEIQIALIVLSGVFLSKTCDLIKKRDIILDRLSDDVNKDALTGIYNKKYIEKRIKNLFNAKKNNSIAFIDIDDFKKFNTLYGHNFGDEVLLTLCEVVNDNIKDYENTYFIRVGGDEFMIFSQDFNKEEFISILQDTVKDVSTTKIPFGKKKVGIEISVGVASSIEDKCAKYTDLYNLADKRNGIAKKNGKNYVEYK